MRLRVALVPVMLATQMAASGAAQAQLQLVGLKVNDKEMGSIDVLWHQDTHHVNLADLASLDITAQPQADGWAFDTPLGETVLSDADILMWQNSPYLAMPTLAKLGIQARYSPADLQIQLMRAKLPKKDTSQAVLPSITHTPSRFGVQGMHLDTQLRGGRSDTSQRHAIDVFGYAMGGAWGLSATKDDDQKTKLDNAYWFDADEQTAVRLGSTNTPFETMTGIDVAYSNVRIDRHLTHQADGKTDSLLNSDVHDLQHISGVGVAGGLAELRINGATVARVQSLLDGRYEFLNLDMSRVDRQSLIEVVIFDNPYTLVPVRTERLSLGKRQTRVATNEVLMQAGLGRTGVFDDKGAKMSYAQLSYGIHNKVSLSAGIRHKDAKTTSNQTGTKHTDTLWQVGASIAPNRHTNLDIDYTSDGKLHLEAGYEYGKWRTNYRLSRQNHQDRHHAGIYYTPSKDRYFSITQDNNQTSLYARTRINEHLSHDIQYQSRDDYWRYRISQDRAFGKRTNSYAYALDPYKHQLSSSHQLSDDTTLHNNLYISHGLRRSIDRRAVSFGSRLQHRMSEHHSVSAGASWHNLSNKIGFEGSWNYRAFNGVNVSAGYHRGGLGINVDRLDDVSRTTGSGEWFLRMSLNAHKSPGSLPKLGRYTSSSGTHGQAVVTLIHDQQHLSKAVDELMYFNINQKLISANPLSVTAKKSTYLFDLPQGVHEMGLDGRSLPIEYALPAKAVASIDARVPTYIEWQLTQTFGIRGRLAMGGQGGVAVQAWQGEGVVASAWTDDDGYFLLDGLPKGEYVLHADGYDSKKVVVVDDYVLGIVLTKLDESVKEQKQ
ncbi:Uncharacterised protein [Moraxella ovis]|nr:carboxypeptidase-like regulatory domain-containing protein [Moraxella ovis]SPX86844.1 Uncharacterised protein [Moraxella ovis]STZ05591.1 Uncharacterised protein [Moraxella ovis]